MIHPRGERVKGLIYHESLQKRFFGDTILGGED